jgi:NAD(P)-dependent dehydrogenase (short-subunit alcohol dehydrogenase family)
MHPLMAQSRVPEVLAAQCRIATLEAQVEALGDAGRWLELCKDMPFGRPGKPEDIADGVAFLASPRSGYTSGTILTIDGGAP